MMANMAFEKTITQIATVELLDHIISSLNKTRNNYLYLYMDLSKVFNALEHNGLLDKLSYYGVEGAILQWFRSYLSNCSLYVEII